MKWKIDPEAFEQAKDLLQIQLPVRVRFIDKDNSTDTMTGKYHGLMHWGITSNERLAEPTHHISIGASLSAYSANEHLWHEMTHAAQSEDYLPDEPQDGLEPYQIANKGMRMAFAKELRRMKKSYSYDTALEKEAVHFMKNGKALKIIVEVDKKGKKKDRTLVSESVNPTPKTYTKIDNRKLWRIDLWKADSEGGGFVDTCYCRALTELDARSWARTEHMKKMNYSNNIVINEIEDRPDEEDTAEDDGWDYQEDWSGLGGYNVP